MSELAQEHQDKMTSSCTNKTKCKHSPGGAMTRHRGRSFRCLLVALLYLANQSCHAQEAANFAAAQDQANERAPPPPPTLQLPTSSQADDLPRANQSSETQSTETTSRQQAQTTELSSGVVSASAAAAIPARQELDEGKRQGASVASQQNDSSLAPLAARPPQPQLPAARSAPILRPSIEEVASELSKKYLNLERHKQQMGASVPPADPQAAAPGGASSDVGDDAEQEIVLGLASAPPRAHHQGRGAGPQAETKSGAVEVAQELRYLRIDAIASPASFQRSNSGQAKHSRKRKNQRSPQKAPATDKDTELSQCQAYLQQHSTAHQALLNPDPSPTAGLLAYSASQLLPCSCQQTAWHFAGSDTGQLPRDALELLQVDELWARVWLNCDNIQLIGSQLFTPTAGPIRTNSSAGSNSNSTRRDLEDDDDLSPAISKFSQRDAGLQVLFSQKFHYLQLAHLKSIDLSRNRIRQIKMDAFHGLENTLEFLNLAHNLLGDSRAMSPAASPELAEQRNNGRLVFTSDQLSRLKRLKWLSLRDNQIDQLGASVFSQPPQASAGQPGQGAAGSDSSSPLVYLDLADNLLKSVPSEALQRLDALQVLRLSGNRILQLDQASKFPRSLRYLDLSGNLISSIQHSQLVDLRHLYELDLSHNQLRQLDQTAFLSAAVAMSSGASAGSAQQQESAGGLVQQLAAAAAPADPHKTLTRHRRHSEDLEANEGSPQEDEDEPLEADESIFSAITIRFRGAPSDPNQRQQQQLSEALQVEQPSKPPPGQFNATLKLNLSHNFLEDVPGDSLLKFAHLQVLDLAHNRIRRLDANYLCSIYNLVDNLRHLDLSGNLLSLSSSEPPPGEAKQPRQRHLNKLFGCLQRLEKLLLGTNRLAGEGSPRLKQSAPPTPPTPDEVEFVHNSGAKRRDRELDLDEAADESQWSSSELALGPARLVVKFGENLGSRQLNTLDLSDNQLQLFPLVELTPTGGQPAQSIVSGPASQAQLMGQWMGARVHLEVLNLDYNQLERLEGQDLEPLASLQQLHLNFNRLTSLPARALRRLTSLEHLSLAGNQIGSLEPVHELFERSLRSLRRLNLANNRLLGWPELSRSSPSLFGSLHSAELAQTQTAAPLEQGRQSSGDFGALEELNLEGNLLTSANVSALFDQLIYMKSLRTLNLSYNLLNRVQSHWFKFANGNLRRLLLTGNKINQLDMGAFARNQVDELAHLRLDYNLLKELKRKTFESMPRIRELNLAHNLLHTINSETFHQLNSLQVLKLNNNKLTSWKCEYFSHLCNSISGQINVDLAALTSSQRQPAALSGLLELDLSHNSLSQLRANSISVHTKLTRLDLSHNKLSFLPPDLFRASAAAGAGAGAPNPRQHLHLVSPIKYLNLAHNRLQTIDNINLKPMRNLLALDLSYNDLQSLGVDVAKGEQADTPASLVVSTNLTSLLLTDETLAANPERQQQSRRPSGRAGRADSLYSAASSWPTLSKLRHLNLAHNALSVVNQSLLSELSPFVSLKLDLSHNYLDSDSLPAGFFTKIASSAGRHLLQQQQQTRGAPQNATASTADPPAPSYDLVFTLKLESLDLSHNRLGEWPASLLDTHYGSLESCNLAHNRIQHLPRGSNSMVQIKSLSLEFNPLSREASELLLSEQRSARKLSLAATRLYAIQLATAESVQYTQQSQQALLASPGPGGRPAGPQQRAARLLVNQTSQLDLIRSISKPIEAPYLRHLNLSSNQLVWLAAGVFERMHSLQTLDLSNNQLTRLHLLSNQLAQVSGSLELLNLNSNLFTSLDAADFSQLARLRQLDLSDLLSLQKLNCRFLAKLGTLRRLRMFNYPQLRSRLGGLVSSVLAAGKRSDSLQRKLLDELQMSTVGGHCFQLEPSNQPLGPEANSRRLGWFKLEELELELFNSFGELARKGSDSAAAGFQLTDELHQLLGPQTRRLTLLGLNLTQLADDSLLGATGDRLDLKISYTSLARLPLRQILAGLPKRSRLRLDLRNNNIQTIDMDALQWLEQLQQMSQANSNPDESSTAQSAVQEPALRLAANPFRCDCHTRPLWLWLNQRWDHLVEVPRDVSDEQLGDSAAANSVNFWLRQNTISQSSDLKCFYPAKLRGKMAQHVYYNDLVCKGTSASAAKGPRRRRNDTQNSAPAPGGARPGSDSYYLLAGSEPAEYPQEEPELDEDYQDLAPAADGVQATRFNRYPAAVSNSSSAYFLANFPTVPFEPDEQRPRQQPDAAKDQDPQSDTQDPWTPDAAGAGSSQRLGKRDQTTGDAGQPADGQPQVVANTKYGKHKPNTLQRHAHYSTLTNLNSAKFGRGPGKAVESTSGSLQANSHRRHSLLTDSDVLILSVASIAMALMTFIIVAVCLIKRKLDRSSLEEEQMLSTHSKTVISRALFTATTARGGAATAGAGSSDQGGGGDNPAGSKQSSARSKGDAKAEARRRAKSNSKSRPGAAHSDKPLQAEPGSPADYHQQTHVLAASAAKLSPRQWQYYPPLVATGAGHHPAAASMGLFAPVAQNFLMRSPTIRRMQGLAGSASDWFKYTLRAYPSASGSRRRRLFMQHNAVCASQLSTAKLMASASAAGEDVRLQRRHERRLARSLSSLGFSGCPVHAFQCFEGLDESGRAECLHCARLLASFQAMAARGAARKVAASDRRPSERTSPKAAAAAAASSSSSSSAASSVKAQKQTKANFQQTIADRQQSGANFMPPKMIQALAQQLDQEQAVAAGQQQLLAKNRAQPAHIGRRSNSRPMKTFGSSQQAAAAHNQGQLGTLQTSQIPTVDVDGRFAYQSDLSQLDSPRRAAPPSGGYQPKRSSTTSGELSRLDDERDGHATPASTVATNQEDIFVLVRDSLASGTTTSRTSATRYDDARSQLTSTNTLNCGYQGEEQEGEGPLGGPDQDQCSRTSSPMAYGFMRSSPSATTLSSATNSRQASQYVVNKSPPPAPVALGHYGAQAHCVAPGESGFQEGRRASGGKAGEPPLDDNNNSPAGGGGYVNAILRQFQAISQQQQRARPAANWAHASPRPQQHADRPSAARPDDHEEQLIVSRL